MFPYRIAFAAPWYFAILAIVPPLWIFSFRRLARMGGARRIEALILRTCVVAVLAAALAEPQVLRTNDRLTVIYLLDQSLSIPADQRKGMLDYVNAEARRRAEGDRAGAIAFGGDAAIESPPLADKLQLAAALESPIDPEHTNIAAAMKLAHAEFPEDGCKRIVIVSDGNQNQGDAMTQARGMAAAGVGIDVVSVRYPARDGVAVERLILPGEVRQGQSFELRVVLGNSAAPKARESGKVGGRLIVSRSVDDRPITVSDEAVVLPPGKTVFSVRQQIDAANFYTFEARFVPERAGDDAMPQTKRATAFTHVRGKGQVLVIEDADHPGDYDVLVGRLRKQGMEVTVRNTAALFSSLAELKSYDTVLLANVPRVSDGVTSFSDEQIEILVRNTQQLGAGLVMLGGPNSFGAGGWAGSELEKAMPVDFQVRNAEVAPRGALVLVIDKSGSMAGQKIAACKAAALAAARTLGPHDLVGVVAFDVDAYWIVPMQEAGDVNSLARRVDRLDGNGGTNMKPGILAAYEALAKAEAPVKHMIVLTDGITEGSGYPELAARMHNENITVSCLAVGGDAAKDLMRDIAAAGGGKSYNVTSLRAIPRIFQREALRVARPLIYETVEGMSVQIASAHEMTNGIESLPPITGYVLTTRKPSALAEVALLAPKPGDAENRTILAGWTYGLGRAVAFTTDAGARWTKSWPRQAAFDKLFGQIVRWSMRPAGDNGNFTCAFEPRDGKMQLTVNALDKNDAFLNFLTLTASVVGPDLKQPLAIDFQQAGPGRYQGMFSARDAGNYFVTIDSGQGAAPIRTGVSVPYSDEFRDQTANDALLKELAATVPKGGVAGKLIEGFNLADSLKSLPAVDTFRHDLPAVFGISEVWPWMLLIASCVFLGDVFARRVRIEFAWAAALAARCRNWILLRRPTVAGLQAIDRLRSRKAEVSGQLEQLRAGLRFEPPPDAKAGEALAEEPTARAAAGPSHETPPEQTAGESYTERLLRVKKKALGDRSVD